MIMRNWVYRALKAVIIDKTYSNLYLKNHLNELGKKDRALATRIFYGTLQNYKYCQWMYRHYIKKSCSKELDVLLSMSVYQLNYLDKVPQYAIVNDAVAIAKKKNQKQADFVNAVLHKVIHNKICLPKDEVERLSIETSTDLWLLNMWKSQYGLEKMEQMAKASTSIMPVYVRRNSLKITEEELLNYDEIEKLEGMDLYKYNGNSISSSPLYQNGCISVQEIGSYAISKFLGPNKEDIVLDCCSAPGTKAFAMAEMMDNIGRLDCLDIHEHRVRLIEQDEKRLGLSICHAYCMDATNLSELGMYDKILCDVPCSGYGIFARKPDIKLRLNPSDMDSLIPIQEKIFDEASKHLKVDGILVYSTCTMNKKENEKQIEKFLITHSNFRLIEDKTLFPSVDHDGFYMAKLVRVEK